MQARKLFAVFPLWEVKPTDLVRRFGMWWLNEFLNLFPEKIAKRLVRKGRNVLILAVGQEIVTLDLQSHSRNSVGSEQVKLTDYLPATIDRFLQLRGLDRSDVDIAVRLPSESIFCSRFTLPLEASNAIDEIIAQSLLKKTPFKLDDIYFDHVAIKADGGKKIAVWQWITRRKFVHESLLRLKIDPETVALVVAAGDAAGEEPPPVIKLRPRAQARKSWLQKSVLALTCTAVVLGSVAGGHRYWRQQMIVDDLETQIATARPRAQQVRGLIDKLREKQNVLGRLRLHRNNAHGLIDLWEEATRVLPSHTWLTELRLGETQDKQEQQMVIIGFSAAAPTLVGIIDSSPLFSDTALTAPVSLDPVERVERFTLQAKVVRSGQIGKPSR